MTVRKTKSDGKPDPYALARLLVDNQDVTLAISIAYNSYQHFNRNATKLDPLWEQRRDALVTLANAVLHKLHKMDALPPLVRVPLPSPRGNRILRYIAAQCAQTGECPSYREIAAGTGFKVPSAVQKHIKLLERDGFLTAVPGQKRSLSLTPKGEQVL